MASSTGSGGTLRERKRDRTRKALIDAAVDLFERNGYDGTTVADIAEAADIGTRTFFSYFASKEELLFPESDARVAAAVTAIANRQPGDRPADVLLRALRDVGAPDGEPDDMVDRIAAVRVALFRTVPGGAGAGPADPARRPARDRRASAAGLPGRARRRSARRPWSARSSARSAGRCRCCSTTRTRRPTPTTSAASCATRPTSPSAPGNSAEPLTTRASRWPPSALDERALGRCCRAAAGELGDQRYPAPTRRPPAAGLTVGSRSSSVTFAASGVIHGSRPSAAARSEAVHTRSSRTKRPSAVRNVCHSGFQNSCGPRGSAGASHRRARRSRRRAGICHMPEASTATSITDAWPEHGSPAERAAHRPGHGQAAGRVAERRVAAPSARAPPRG